jgi:hypothetical protein
MPSALDNYGQSCFVRSDFLKMKCVCKTHMMPPPDYKKEMKSNYLSFCEYLTKIPPPTFHRGGIKKWLKSNYHYQILNENQNPVDMHTTIICIDILQNIKAVAPKL